MQSLTCVDFDHESACLPRAALRLQTKKLTPGQASLRPGASVCSIRNSALPKCIASGTCVCQAPEFGRRTAREQDTEYALGICNYG